MSDNVKINAATTQFSNEDRAEKTQTGSKEDRNTAPNIIATRVSRNYNTFGNLQSTTNIYFKG